jgi:diguanylate cyclase (GGDEF)-like protein
MVRALRQLFVPHAFVLAAAVAVLGSPLRRYASSPQVQLIDCLALLIALFLSWRFRSLRGFLAASALLVLLAESLLLAPHTILAANAMMALTLTLILLVDDHFFDWRATAYWAGLLFLQGSLLFGIIRSSPSFAGSPRAELFIAVGAVAIAVAAIRHPEPILNGLFWILLCLALASRFGWQSAYAATAALILVIAILEGAYRLAYHDELTGLSGRRAFNGAIAELSENYCIAMVDVDHFKSFNDTFGHDTGDQVLRKVAARLAEVRAGGTAFRCGGEEFALVFPTCDLNEALAEVEELRKRIERDVFVVRGPDRSHRKRSERRTGSRRARRQQSFATNVTVSIGVADCTRVNDPEQVVALADRALYVAKNSGRNRVEAASPAERVSVKRKAGSKLPTVGIAR